MSVTFCNWCPDPLSPDPSAHPGGQAWHLPPRVAGTFEEWRVTGDPGEGFPPYDFTWSPFRNPHLGDPEGGARGFVALIAGVGGWPDGPHLSRRTVTVTEWEPVGTDTTGPSTPAQEAL